MQIGHLLRPKIKDLARPRRDVAHNAEVINTGVGMLAMCLKIGLVGQFTKVGFLGVFEKFLRSIGGYVKSYLVYDMSASWRCCRDVPRFMLGIMVGVIVEEGFHSWWV